MSDAMMDRKGMVKVSKDSPTKGERGTNGKRLASSAFATSPNTMTNQTVNINRFPLLNNSLAPSLFNNGDSVTWLCVVVFISALANYIFVASHGYGYLWIGVILTASIPVVEH